MTQKVILLLSFGLIIRYTLPPLVVAEALSRSLLNIEKRSLLRLMLSGDGLASKNAL